MNKKILAVLMAALLIAVAVVSSCAHTPDQQNAADALNELGLFLGKGGDAGYALDDPLNRMEGVTLLVRMIGKETAAKNGNFTVPFTDVNTTENSWAKPYVGYAYQNGITNGYGPDVFGAEDAMTDYMFLTLTLRALGYSDKGTNPQFAWDNPYELAESVGLISNAKADDEFLRGDAVNIFWNALDAKRADKDAKLVDTLIEAGVFTREKYEIAKDIYKNGRTAPSVTDTSADTTAPVTTVPEDTLPPYVPPVTTPEDTLPPFPSDTTTSGEDIPIEDIEMPENMTPIS